MIPCRSVGITKTVCKSTVDLDIRLDPQQHNTFSKWLLKSKARGLSPTQRNNAVGNTELLVFATSCWCGLASISTASICGYVLRINVLALFGGHVHTLDLVNNTLSLRERVRLVCCLTLLLAAIVCHSKLNTILKVFHSWASGTEIVT